MEAHDRTVAEVAHKVKLFHEQKKPFRIFHGSTNSTRPITVQQDVVDTSSLNHVLAVDKEKLTALVEPNVPMDQLVSKLSAHGLVPPVVMEFPGITVGGGVSGTSGESSSFRHGFFDDTVNWIEAVLATGEVVKASRQENAELFSALASSCGTIGVLTLVELRLIPTRRYVEVTYTPVVSMEDALEKTRTATADENIQYCDGVLFALNRGYIITGKLTDEGSYPIRQFSKSKDEWFYVHVEGLPRDKPTKELVPLAEYIFRYDRGAFWMGRYALKYFVFPFTRTTRRILDFFMHTRTMYRAMHASGHGSLYFIQDVGLPYSTVSQFVDYTDKEFGIYPLWLCPLKIQHDSLFHPHAIDKSGNPEKMLMNVGIWGPRSGNYDKFIADNRSFERKLKELRGTKWFYAHTYYTEEEFWDLYDKPTYEAQRQKYGATLLPSIYQKVKVDEEAQRKRSSGILATRPLSGYYGALQALLSRGK
jgi:delta24-sterol reductase